MTHPSILALATATPEARHSQDEILEEFLWLLEQHHLPARQRAIRAVFGRSGVRYRHTVVEQGYFAAARSTQARNTLYMEAALPLGERLLRQVMVGHDLHEVDDLIIVSCTGYSTPGLDLLLAGRLGMRPNLHRACVMSMGCYGAFPGLLRAVDAAAAGRTALMLSLELCSLHLQMDASAQNVVSASLFADGAGALLVGAAASPAAAACQPRILHAATHSDYNSLEHMSFELTDEGFRMYLSSYVPDLLAAKIGPFVDGLLQQAGISRTEPRFWGIHPGSSKIVDYIQQQLGLADEQVRFSHDVLADYGNMSSATILFVLDEIRRCGNPAAGDYGVLLAFGPGLTMEGIVLQW